MTSVSAAPTLDEVLRKLSHLIGDSRTPQQYLNAVGTLSSIELEVVITSTTKYHVAGDEKEKFRLGVAQSLSSSDGQAYLLKAANDAHDAAGEILFILCSSVICILFIDSGEHTHYMPQMKEIFKMYCAIILDSIPLARKIAQYGEDFDTKIVQFCADNKILPSERLIQIKEYISAAQGSKESADSIVNRFDGFVATFLDFSAKVRSRSARTKRKFPQPDISLKEFGSLSLAVTANLSESLRQFMTIAGLINLESQDAFNAALSIAASAVTNAKARIGFYSYRGFSYLVSTPSGREIDDDEVIKAADAFRKHFTVLKGYWESAMADAHEIQLWLEDGADDVKWPKYMKENLDHGAQIYVAMARYLTEYAKGVEDFHLEKVPED
ncbi:hypothetical protein BDV23DRAFT_189821 [Aspergillus alliaceus]|uniref:Uncharacterized protein n=1 Tax=Petromyces alliaceus TaxID=209559 RepID=A0A5N7BQ68_PETAA|nr:hypothetical protein BDV23DRAFT_189821 [Aspergillus alliaceus]